LGLVGGVFGGFLRSIKEKQKVAELPPTRLGEDP
jgi:hypothetical protein